MASLNEILARKLCIVLSYNSAVNCWSSRAFGSRYKIRTDRDTLRILYDGAKDMNFIIEW